MRLLSLLFLSHAALAGQTVTGTALRISYNDAGNWNWSASGTGLEALLDSEWVDFSYPGNPYQMFALEFEDGGVAEAYYATSYYYTTDLTVTGATDASTATEAVAIHTYTAGSLTVTKTETWDIDGALVVVAFDLTNAGTADIGALRLLYAVDPDQEAASTGSYSTYNDTLDADGDGIDDWLESEGTTTGFTIGFGACEPSLTTLGHYSDWSYIVDADQTLTDGAAASADTAMGIRYTAGVTLAPGDTLTTKFIVSVADTAATAELAYLLNLDRCDCDADLDGYEATACGGEDCDDDDATANPAATEIWYDGVDQDCDGVDDDQDLDGFSLADDCDDLDASANPAGVEIWYDGVDQDCDGNDDDQDVDGFPRADDCDDLDPSVNPDAQEVWYDGVDQDCDGDDADQDGDGAGLGEDCDDLDPDVGPDAEEIWYDGVDQDCDGNDLDQDGDGYDLADDCDDVEPEAHPGGTEEWYDGIDQDCDGRDDDQDDDGVDVEHDCDDTDAALWDDCPDTGGIHVDGTGDGKGGLCGCATGGGAPGLGLAGLLGLAVLGRRRRA